MLLHNPQIKRYLKFFPVIVVGTLACQLWEATSRQCQLDPATGGMLVGLSIALGVVWLFVDFMAHRCLTDLATNWRHALVFGLNFTLWFLLLDWVSQCLTLSAMHESIRYRVLSFPLACILYWFLTKMTAKLSPKAKK